MTTYNVAIRYGEMFDLLRKCEFIFSCHVRSSKLWFCFSYQSNTIRSIDLMIKMKKTLSSLDNLIYHIYLNWLRQFFFFIRLLFSLFIYCFIHFSLKRHIMRIVILENLPKFDKSFGTSSELKCFFFIFDQQIKLSGAPNKAR